MEMFILIFVRATLDGGRSEQAEHGAIYSFEDAVRARKRFMKEDGALTEVRIESIGVR